MIDNALTDLNSIIHESDGLSFVLSLPNGWTVQGSRYVYHLTGLPILNDGISLIAYKNSDISRVRDCFARYTKDFQSFVREIAALP